MFKYAVEQLSKSTSVPAGLNKAIFIVELLLLFPDKRVRGIFTPFTAYPSKHQWHNQVKLLPVQRKPWGTGSTGKKMDSPGSALPISCKVLMRADEISWCHQEEFGFFSHGTSFEYNKWLLGRRISNLTESHLSTGISL